MPQHPFCWSTRSFICHMGLGQILASDRYALVVLFLIIACLRSLKDTVIAIATHGNRSETMSWFWRAYAEIAHRTWQEQRNRREGWGVSGLQWCSHNSLVWEGVGSALALVPPLLTAVTTAVINPLNGEFVHCSWPTAHLPTAPCTTFRNFHTSLAL